MSNEFFFYQRVFFPKAFFFFVEGFFFFSEEFFFKRVWCFQIGLSFFFFFSAGF